jgi:hypothetical protein
MELTDPWYPVADQTVAGDLLAELRRELSPGHVLASRSVEPIGRREDRDDILVALADGGWAIVHLTWQRATEADPSFPVTSLFENLADLRRRLDSDAEEFAAS